jgi:hypothetical protein
MAVLASARDGVEPPLRVRPVKQVSAVLMGTPDEHMRRVGCGQALPIALQVAVEVLRHMRLVSFAKHRHPGGRRAVQWHRPKLRAALLAPAPADASMRGVLIGSRTLPSLQILAWLCEPTKSPQTQASGIVMLNEVHWPVIPGVMD